MITEAISYAQKKSYNRQESVWRSDADDHFDFFTVYLDFVIDWIRADADTYLHAINLVYIREIKEFFISMVSRKMQMFDTFSVYRPYGHSDWFEKTLGNGIPKLPGKYLIDQQGRPIQNMLDAFSYVYQKESYTLTLFEKIKRAKHDAMIQTLLNKAIDFQRDNIRFLDDRLVTYREKAATDRFQTILENAAS